MVGVVHATNPIDAIQRFLGRIEMGVIPQIIDTVFFIKNGFINRVLSLKMMVKVPSGMTEADLARPIVVVTDFETGKAAYEILKDADAIITHYGKRFDMKFLNARLAHHGLPLLPRLTHIDTWSVARQHLKITSNRLDSIAEFLKVERKMNHGQGWQLWVDVMARKKRAQNIMSRYCIQDVECLEAVFKKLRPFINNIPNYNILNAKDHSCPSCGSDRVCKNGKRTSKAGVYQRWHCKDCGSVSREKHPIKTYNKLKGI